VDTDKLEVALAEKLPGHPDTAILADGFSCRTQLAAGRTGREGLHLAQLLARITADSSSPGEP